MIKWPTIFSMIIFLCLGASRKSHSQTTNPTKKLKLSSSGHEMALTVQQYTAGLRDLNRAWGSMRYTVLAQKKAAYFKKWKQKLSNLSFDQLSQEAKVDYILLHNAVKKDEYSLKKQQHLWKNLQPALPFADQVLRLTKMRRWGQTPDGQKAAATYDSIGREIKKVQGSLNHIDLNGVHNLPFAMRAVKSLRKNLQQVYKFYNGYNPSFTWWIATSYKTTDSLFDRYIDNLHAKIAQNVAGSDNSGIPGVPIGKEQLLKEIHFKMIPYKPKELIDIANREYAWCLKQMKKASSEMGYGDDWKAALEAVKEDHVPVGKQPEEVVSLLKEAMDFIGSHHLIKLPDMAKNTWTMIMMTPQRQLINPFFTGGRRLSISYPTNTMSYQDKMESMRGNNIPQARATIFHEMLPGHYLQFFMGERYRPYRRIFHTPFWTEGWTFYWEMLLWDTGYDKTPKQKIGALYWYMTRCARIVFNLKFQMGEWTTGKCVHYLVKKAGLEPANAKAEVRRSFGGRYDPLYQLAYMVGALQFKALHHELVDSGKMSNNEFHQEILRQNNMPIEMVRALLEDTPLEKDYQPYWKFYKEIKR